MKGFISTLLIFLATMLPCHAVLNVSNLTVNTLTEPTGIDTPPAFGWVLSSDSRSVAQKSYNISIYSSPKSMRPLWSSGTVDSENSTGVKTEGLVLQPFTRYYWNVTVTDNNGNTATSHQLASFLTGTMGDWSGAEWVCADDFTHGSAFSDGNSRGIQQDFETTITVHSGNPTFIFGADEARCGFMWKLDLSAAKPVLRRSYRAYSDITDMGATELSSLNSSDLKGKPFDILIVADDISNRSISTYINGTLVDKCSNVTTSIRAKKIGYADQSNLYNADVTISKLRLTFRFGDRTSSQTVIDEDFSLGHSSAFTGIDITPGALHLGGTPDGYNITSSSNEAVAFYKQFNINKPVAHATLCTSGLGVYNIFLNGNEVGDDVLKPGWTDYSRHFDYFTHDVTDLCSKGENTIVMPMSRGWLTGSISCSHYNIYDKAILVKLLVEYTDGTTEIIGSDTSWKVSKTSPLIYGEIYQGEFYDARLGDFATDFHMPDFPFSTYPRSYNFELRAHSGQLTIKQQPVMPKSVTVYEGVTQGGDFGQINTIVQYNRFTPFTLHKGQTAIFDYGCNATYLPHLTVKGSTGTRLKMRMAEALNSSGLVADNNDGPKGSIYRANMRSDINNRAFYVLGGNISGESYTGSHSFYGYRYCEVTATDDVEILAFDAVPITASHQRTGEIDTDNRQVKLLTDAVEASQRSNMITLPIDCPQRDERWGWTGDIQVFATTALYNANIATFLRHWLADMRAAQNENGAFPDIAPQPTQHYGNSGWADAGVIIPYKIFLMTGDDDVIHENYEAMTRYMDYLSTLTDGNIKHPGAGTNYGDWWSYPTLGVTNPRFVSQAFYIIDARCMASMAEAIGNHDDAARYEELAQTIAAEMRSMYLGASGLKSPSQGACILALHAGLCGNDESRDAVAKQLVNLIASNGGKFDIGFVTTPLILPVLCENGYPDIAYNLLLQRGCPGWMYMIDNGATSIWEHWDGITENGAFVHWTENSFNHFNFGSVQEWMYSHMAGLSPDPAKTGFKHIIMRPYPDMRASIPQGQQRIGSAKATFRTPYGEAAAHWTATGDHDYIYDVTVPAGTTATVMLPAGDASATVYDNSTPASEAEGVTDCGYRQGCRVLEVGSGTYSFGFSPHQSGVPEIETDELISVTLHENTLHVNADDLRRVTLIDTRGIARGTWHESVISLSHMQSGIYIVTVETGSAYRSFKIALH